MGKKLRDTSPSFRLCFMVFMLFSAFMPFGILWEALLTAVNLLLELMEYGSLKRLRPVLAALLAVTLQVVSMQFLFAEGGEVIWQWWIFSLRSGSVLNILNGILKAAAAALATVRFLVHTTAGEATAMLAGWGVPFRYAYIPTLTAVFLPVLREEYRAVRDARIARGIPYDTAMDRIRMLFPTFMPFLLRSLRRANDTALCLEMRGYGRKGEHTYLASAGTGRKEKILMCIMAAAALVLAAVPLIY